MHVLRGHTDAIRALTISPDGRRIATAGMDHTARTWDADTGEQIAVLTGHEAPVRDITYSSAGRLLLSAVGRDKTVRLWVAESGFLKASAKKHAEPVIQARFLADGNHIYTTAPENSNTLIWSGEPARPIGAFGWHAIGVRGVAASPDSTRIAVWS